MRIAEKLRDERIAEIGTFKKTRNAKAALDAMDKLSRALKENRNSLPFILRAVECGATLGEISDCFRNILGVHNEYTGI